MSTSFLSSTSCASSNKHCMKHFNFESTAASSRSPSRKAIIDSGIGERILHFLLHLILTIICAFHTNSSSSAIHAYWPHKHILGQCIRWRPLKTKQNNTIVTQFIEIVFKLTVSVVISSAFAVKTQTRNEAKAMLSIVQLGIDQLWKWLINFDEICFIYRKCLIFYVIGRQNADCHGGRAFRGMITPLGGHLTAARKCDIICVILCT